MRSKQHSMSSWNGLSCSAVWVMSFKVESLIVLFEEALVIGVEERGGRSEGLWDIDFLWRLTLRFHHLH